MSQRIIRLLTIVFVVVSMIFFAIGLYCVGDIASSSRIGESVKILVIVMVIFCISYGFLSFIIMALILREAYKLLGKTKERS